jgi:multimeric flavodoxin WrbA
MKILVLNGSPRKNGNIVKTLKNETERLQKKFTESELCWKDVCDLSFDFCKGCMACRSKGKCILPEDDAHKIAEEIKSCDFILVGTPVYWGNMNGKMKSLFDRLVADMMGESKLGIPIPLHKGKKAIIVTSCTTPFPFNYLCGQSTGAVHAVKEILKSSGFRVVRKINLSNTKNKKK